MSHNSGGEHFGAGREARMIAARDAARRKARRPTVGDDCLERLRRMRDEKRREWVAGNAPHGDMAALDWAYLALDDWVNSK